MATHEPGHVINLSGAGAGNLLFFTHHSARTLTLDSIRLCLHLQKVVSKVIMSYWHNNNELRMECHRQQWGKPSGWFLTQTPPGSGDQSPAHILCRATWLRGAERKQARSWAAGSFKPEPVLRWRKRLTELLRGLLWIVMSGMLKSGFVFLIFQKLYWWERAHNTNSGDCNHLLFPWQQTRLKGQTRSWNSLQIKLSRF